MKLIKVLELFAGSRSIWRAAEQLWMEVCSVDYKQWGLINLVIDIYKLTIKDLPWIPNIWWASPDCTTYSIAACKHHRFLDKTARSKYAKICDIWNKIWIKLMLICLKLNPDMVCFIENPRWNMRHMDFMIDLVENHGFVRHTVWYCKYWDDRAKPTDIWTNSKTWIPRPMCRNYKYDKYGNIIDKHCHHESARRWARTWTQWRKNAHERSKIPDELCKEILKSIQ